MTEDTSGYVQPQRQEQHLEMRAEQSNLPYQALKDLELFSINRIRDRLATLEIGPEVRWRITECLAEENRKQWPSKNHRRASCTPYTLDHCVEKLREYLEWQVSAAIESLPPEAPELAALQDKLQRGVTANIATIKNYLSQHYTLILCNTRGVIPAPVVRKMKEKVQRWAKGNREVLSEPLEPLIKEIADGLGLYTMGYSSRRIWDELMKVA
ncbi:hypothetical protein HZC30_05280 [Candidatus Woesearchaeota archaeon]|nr:hypothetical protein [Candidatus Woesearchaeota archaeon]